MNTPFHKLLTRWLLPVVLLLTVLSQAARADAYTFTAANYVPISAGSYAITAETTINLSLGYVPHTGTNLTVINNTGLGFIQGRFTNLAQGQTVILTYNDRNYPFVANYYGGTGNDLVLQWAGNLLCGWGGNTFGQIGNGSNTDSNVPVAVTSSGVLAGKTIISISSGGRHSLALCSDGTVAAWGANNYGQLGNGSRSYTDTNVPVAVNDEDVLLGKTVIAISAGGFHSLALCSDGTVASWGYNEYGGLGDGTYTNNNVPVAVNTSGVLLNKTVVAISAGGVFSLALCSDGTLVSWGSNFLGKLGNGFTTDSNVPVAVKSDGLLNGKTVVAITTDFDRSLVQCSDGTLATWGYNNSGQLGTGSLADNSIEPVAVQTSGALNGMTVVAFTARGRHSVVLCSDGTLAGWGHNVEGELGVGNNSIYYSEPTVIVKTHALAGKTVTSVEASTFHSMALCSDGRVVAWGGNYYGELGNGTNNTNTLSNPPVEVSRNGVLAGKRVTAISSSSISYSTLAIAAIPVNSAPTLTTPTSASIAFTTATLGGTVTSDGGDPITERGVVYSPTATNSNPQIGGVGVVKATTTGTTGIFTVDVTGLSAGTDYTFAAYATNGVDTSYTSLGTFSTIPPVTISDLAEQQVLKHGISPWLDFTVGPAAFAGQITVTGVSNDQTLLPVSGIEFDGTGTARRVRLKPNCGQTGQAEVFLTATLSGSSVTTSFIVNVVVRPPADAAEITGLGSLINYYDPLSIDSTAQVISANGNVVAGTSTGRLFRWTDGGGMEEIISYDPITLTGISSDGSVIGGYVNSFFNAFGQVPKAYLSNSGSQYIQELQDSFQLNGLSGDGSVAVGHLDDPVNLYTPDQPVRWSNGNGITHLSKGGAPHASATAISSDGSIVVGWGGDNISNTYALVWLDMFFFSDPVGLPSLPGATFCAATAVSADGSVIVGYSDAFAHPGIRKAVRWVREGFTNNYILHELDSLAPTANTEARAVSADGSRIVGTIGSGFFSQGAFVWDAENGQRLLQTALVYGGANVNTNWASLDEANGISADGLYIVGTGTNASFQREAFRAKLPLIPPTPTISAIANVTTMQDTPTPALPFTLTDTDTNPDCLTVSAASSNPTLVPLPNIVISGSGANRTVTITPAPGGSGSTTITLTVSDSYSSSQQQFSITVGSADPMEAWRFANFGTIANTGVAANEADADGDGQTNFFEYVAGLNPNDPLARFTTAITPVPAMLGQMSISFGPLVPGRTYEVKCKVSLLDPVWLPLVNFTVNPAGDTVTDLDAVGPTKFYHVEITKP